MSGWQRIYYKLLNLPLQVLVKSKSIPAEPAQELGLDTSRPVMYVLPYNSKADLLTLRAQCLAHDLPDPLEPLEIDGALLPRYVFIHGGPRVFTYYTPKEESIKLFHDYLDLHRNHPDLDVQMVPVSVMFGRSPGREKGEVNPPLRMLNGIQKFFAVSWLGRDSFVRFSPSVSLRRMADEHGTDKIIAQKLARVARMHFARQRLAAVGPRLPARQDLFNKLLASKAIARAVEDEARSKKISHEKAQQNAIALMEEIAANFSYEMIRLTDRILGFPGTACTRASTCITPSAYASWRTTAMKLSMSPATAVTWTICCSPTSCTIRGWSLRISRRASTSTSGRPDRSSAASAPSLFAAPLRATSSIPPCSANTLANCSAAAIPWSISSKAAAPVPAACSIRRPVRCR